MRSAFPPVASGTASSFPTTGGRPPSGCTTSTSRRWPGESCLPTPMTRNVARGGAAVVGSGGHCCVSALAYRLLPGRGPTRVRSFQRARGVFQHSTTSLRTARAHAGIVCTRGCDGPGLDASRPRSRHPARRTLGAVPGRASGRRMLQTMPAKVLRDHRPRRGRTRLVAWGWVTVPGIPARALRIGMFSSAYRPALPARPVVITAP